MIPLVKRIALFSLAIAIGAAAFTFVCRSQALAAGCTTICYQNRTYTNVPPPLQTVYLNNGGVCGACNPVSGN